MSTRVVSGVLLAPEDAAYLARLLADSARALGRHGVYLPDRAVTLARFLADASSDVRASTPATPSELLVSSESTDADPLIDTATAAEVLGCTTANVRDLCRRGRLQGVRHNGRWLVEQTSLRELKESR